VYKNRFIKNNFFSGDQLKAEKVFLKFGKKSKNKESKLTEKTN
jgi:hypothetical protein